MKQIKRGEIYFADLSPVVGSEQTGLRPVLFGLYFHVVIDICPVIVINYTAFTSFSIVSYIFCCYARIT